MERIAIIGTGLIGSSIGLGLKAGNLKDLEIVGYDESSEALGNARKAGAVDTAVRALPDAVREARLVIVATPALAARTVLEDIAPRLEEGTIVTDTLSTKAEIMRWARQLLPETVNYVGGHPMAGKATSAGATAADAALFRGKAYAVVPSPKASESAVRAVLGLVSVLGAEPVFLHPEEHDQYVAAVSHLPMALAFALFTLARKSAAWPEMRQLAGNGFIGATRLASGDPQMTHDIFVTNGEAIIHWVDRFIEELRSYRGLIADDPAELFKTFATAQLNRDAFLEGTDTPQGEKLDLPSPGEQVSSLLFGEFLASRVKDYEKRMQDSNRREQR